MLVANIVKLNDFLQSACRSIADMVSKAGVQDLTGLAGTGENIQGEEQKKLDILSNDVFKDKLTKTGCMVRNNLHSMPISRNGTPKEQAKRSATSNSQIPLLNCGSARHPSSDSSQSRSKSRNDSVTVC
jgi:hypothetical protein